MDKLVVTNGGGGARLLAVGIKRKRTPDDVGGGSANIGGGSANIGGGSANIGGGSAN